MELFRAGKAVKNTLQKWIDDSDIYLLILGGRYGSIDDNTGKSFTQWEYEYAIDTGKPTFAIVLSDTYLREKEKEQKGDIFETENKEKYDKFKKLVLNKTVYKVNSLSEITSKILIQLQEYTVDPKLVKHGWIRINTAAEPSTAMGKDLFQQLYFENLLPDREPLPELREYVDRQYGVFTDLRDSFGLFLKELTRSIRVTLKDDYIEIENSSSFHYYKRKDRSYIHQFFPWLRQGTETDTYQFSHVKYNHDDKNNGMRYVHHGEHKPTDNPFYFHGAIGLTIPLKKDEEHHEISYISKYHVDYAQLFHSYSFPFFCQSFRIMVQMFDKRKSKKNGKYMLRWEMATPYSMDYAYNSKRMVQQKEDIIEFNSLSWMTPSSSYIVTINYIKNN